MYAARDSVPEYQRAFERTRAALRAQEQGILERKVLAEQVKGPMPYWWELKTPAFGDEAAREKAFGGKSTQTQGGARE